MSSLLRELLPIQFDWDFRWTPNSSFLSQHRYITVWISQYLVFTVLWVCFFSGSIFFFSRVNAVPMTFCVPLLNISVHSTVRGGVRPWDRNLRTDRLLGTHRGGGSGSPLKLFFFSSVKILYSVSSFATSNPDLTWIFLSSSHTERPIGLTFFLSFLIYSRQTTFWA